MITFDGELCEERHSHIKEILTDHELRLNGQDLKINILEIDSMGYKVNINNLIKKMDSFITIMMWGVGIIVTVSLGLIGVVISIN